MDGIANIHVPAETDWLCEGCGYVLTGLPDGGRCPECGKLTAESAPKLRFVPLWERPDAGSPLTRWCQTTAQVLFHPTVFYRTLATRNNRTASLQFARIHWLIASLGFATAAWIHVSWFLGMNAPLHTGRFAATSLILSMTLLSFVLLAIITRIAARLTALEAGYRGLRMPTGVVLRGLDYHAAHYVPVALLAIATVLAYRLALGNSPTLMVNWAVTYLYTLCAEVIIAAAYLFKTYWIAMRNMMYASR